MLPVNDPTMAFVCRLCERLAEARDAKRETCGQECGGPMKGKHFPRYKGPLTPGFMASHCFICGEPTPISMKVEGLIDGREIGVCKRHIIHFGVKFEEEKAKAPLEDRGTVEHKRIEVPLEEMLGLEEKKDE